LKRSVGDILRLGFESMLANWPLLIIRIVESVVLVVMTLLAIVAVIVAVLLSAANLAIGLRRRRT